MLIWHSLTRAKISSSLSFNTRRMSRNPGHRLYWPVEKQILLRGYMRRNPGMQKIGIKLQQSAVEVITRALQMKTSSPHSEKADITPFDRTKITLFKQHRQKCTPLLNLKLLRNQTASSNWKWLHQLKKLQKNMLSICEEFHVPLYCYAINYYFSSFQHDWLVNIYRNVSISWQLFSLSYSTVLCMSSIKSERCAQ